MRQPTPQLPGAEQAATLLRDLRHAGVTVTPAIDLDGPDDVLTDATLADIGRHKPALLRLLCNPYRYHCIENPHRQRVCDLLADVWERDPLEARRLSATWYAAMDAARDHPAAGETDPDAAAWAKLHDNIPILAQTTPVTHGA